MQALACIVVMRREALVGILSIVALALTYWGVNYLKGTNVLSEDKICYAIYDKIDGLVESDKVVLSGYQVGVVRKIDFHPDNSGRIIVEFSITEKDFRFSEDTKAILVSDILGTKSIQLLPGKTENLLTTGDTLATSIETTIEEAVTAEIRPLKVKVDGLLGQVDTLLEVIQTIMNKDATNNISNSFENIDRAMSTLAKTSQRLDTMVKRESIRISQLTGNLVAITGNLKEKNEEIANTLENIAVITDSVAASDIVSTINAANKALENFADAIEKVNNGEGTLGQLLANDTLYRNLEKSSQDLDLLLKDMRYNPARYVHFSIFGRKNKHVPPTTPSNAGQRP